MLVSFQDISYNREEIATMYIDFTHKRKAITGIPMEPRGCGVKRKKVITSLNEI